MRLFQLRRHWDGLARKDPLFAVLTNSGKDGGAWNLDEFLGTGVAEVARDLDSLKRLGIAFANRTALDFGCGAGRLTQALGGHFGKVTGVDISGEMVSLAQRLCSNERISFVQNLTPDLKQFPDASFDFVYSRITLQHIAPRYTRLYLKEFARVATAGGILFLQIPNAVPPGDPPDQLRFSPWPPTMLMRLSRHVRYHHPGWFPGTPKMQMYAVPRDDVVNWLVDSGLEVVAAEPTDHGNVDNWIYVARRPR